MKRLSQIIAVLCILSAFIFGLAGIGGFFVLGISYTKALLYITKMVVAIMVGVNLYFIAQEEK